MFRFMNTAPLAPCGFELPVRLAFVTATRGGSHPAETVIAGSPGSSGDAGWTIVACVDLAHARRVMAEYPQARMPCWRRLESQDDANAQAARDQGIADACNGFPAFAYFGLGGRALFLTQGDGIAMSLLPSDPEYREAFAYARAYAAELAA